MAEHLHHMPAEEPRTEAPAVKPAALKAAAWLRRIFFPATFDHTAGRTAAILWGSSPEASQARVRRRQQLSVLTEKPGPRIAKADEFVFFETRHADEAQPQI